MCLTAAHYIHWLIKHTVSLATEHTGQLSTGREFYLTLKRNSFLKSLMLPKEISNSKDPNEFKVSQSLPPPTPAEPASSLLYASYLPERDSLS